MNERLRMIEERYNAIQEELQSPEVMRDVKKMTALMKELRNLEKIVSVYHEYLENTKQLEELNMLVLEDDPEIKEMAEMELEERTAKDKEYEEQLKLLLIPKDPNDEKNVIMEIRGAAGGDEANIFAGDLFRMYTRYAESKGWKIEITNAFPADLGGFNHKFNLAKST